MKTLVNNSFTPKTSITEPSTLNGIVTTQMESKAVRPDAKPVATQAGRTCTGNQI
ncbi:hypothetical protein VHA_002495 [Grimontia hollisae CIP 101886]|uniref:Uncharacterized protein n=1 Tax=Grimontia hollisae CIP 101886 TaxID=675812 RepID=D0I9F8_GRIHO|nr:hypothetical protein VHA_002495 [Grimontia hollisae CIP 101886]